MRTTETTHECPLCMPNATCSKTLEDAREMLHYKGEWYKQRSKR